MKTRAGWIVVGVVGLVAVGAAWAAKKELSSMTPEEMKWIDVPESGGAQATNVSGDMAKGAHTAFAKIPAGQTHPLHTHSAEVKGVVVSGSFLVGPEGGPEKALGPGSYFVVPAKMKHTSSCAAGAPCVLFQTVSGKFDMKPVEDKAAAAKK
jgi:quercetin dioxygenase-like cupin family protein